MKDRKRKAKPWQPTFQSDKLSHRVVRRIVKRQLQKRNEPEPRYTTGKFWED